MTSGCATTGGPAPDAGAVKGTDTAPKTAESDENLPESGMLTREDVNSAILFGDGYVFAIEAPEGWVLRDMQDEEGGSYAVLYPEGGSWSVSDAVMYARADTKYTGFSNMMEAISEDIGAFEEENPGVFIKAADRLETRNGANTAEVRLFYYTYFDAVAYIEEENAIVFIVLNTRTNGMFEESLPAFEKLVGSYYYMGDKMKVVE